MTAGAGSTVYAIEYLGAYGHWVEWHTFEQPLDADHAYQRVRALQPAYPIRLVRKVILTDD